jgi:hypothetical protein
VLSKQTALHGTAVCCNNISYVGNQAGTSKLIECASEHKEEEKEEEEKETDEEFLEELKI